jgi:RNA polymerase sigma-70 factor (ECF subfamily)
VALLGPAPTEPGPLVLFAAITPPPARGTSRGVGHVASGTVFVIATHREPLPSTLGRSLPGAPADARERGLVRDAQHGSSDAVEELFRRHWPAAHRAAYLIVQDAAAAEDIAQEAFVAALRALDRFDRRRPFAPWLHRIVANRAIDWSRARTARREVWADDASLAGRDDLYGPSSGVLEALAELPPEQRAVVVLRHLLGYTPGQVASLLDLPRGTVNSRLRRALDRLADQLGARG